MGDFPLVLELQEGIDLEGAKLTFTRWDLDLLGCWRITVPGECCAADVLPSHPLATCWQLLFWRKRKQLKKNETFQSISSETWGATLQKWSFFCFYFFLLLLLLLLSMSSSYKKSIGISANTIKLGRFQEIRRKVRSQGSEEVLGRVLRRFWIRSPKVAFKRSASHCWGPSASPDLTKPNQARSPWPPLVRRWPYQYWGHGSDPGHQSRFFRGVFHIVRLAQWICI